MASKNVFIIFIIFYEFVRISAVSLNVTGVAGQTAELPCFCLEHKAGVVMKFIRPDRSEDRCVIFIRDGRPEPSRQLLEYSGRVNWTSNWVLLIKNVSHEDEGMFMCTGLYKEPESEEVQEVKCPVHLKLTGGNTTVLDLKPGGPGGPGGWDVLSKEWQITIIVFACIGIFIIIFLVIFFPVRKNRKKNKKLVRRDDYDEGDDNDNDDDDGKAKKGCKRLFKCDYIFVKDECSS